LEFFEEKQCESFFERKISFCSSVFEIEKERIFVMKIGRSDSYFVLKVSEIIENEFFLSSESENGNENESESGSDNENENENEKESIVSEKDEIRELLNLSGGSRIEDFSNFSERKLTNVIRIEDSVEMIEPKDFKDNESLKEIGRAHV
jgi:hypothetical protein